MRPTRALHLATALLVAVAALAAVPVGDVAVSTPAEGSPSGVTGEDLVRLAAVTPDDVPLDTVVTFADRGALELLTDLGVRNERLAVLPVARAALTPGQIDALAARPEVRSIVHNTRLDWHLKDSVRRTRAPEVWAEGITGEGVGIAILDTGIDGTHPDLTYPDKTVENVKFVHTRFADFLTHEQQSTTTEPIAGVPNTDTTSGHGTHVGGTAASSGASSSSYRGMAPSASLIGLGAGDVLYIYTALEGFDWLLQDADGDGVPNHAEYDVRVVNNSWGGGIGRELDVDHPIIVATHEVYRAGITVVFSAGNSGPGPDTLNFYATAPWNLGVGATNLGKRLVDFSSRAYPNHPFKTVEVSAPGQSIEAQMHYAWAVTPYTVKSGTSMSAPHVTGLVALILDANPDLSPDQVRQILQASAEPMDSPTWEAGQGFIDAVEAVALAQATPGERSTFLAGDTAWTLERAAATPLPYERVDTATWTGTTTGVGGEGAPHTETLEVSDAAEFLTVRVTWAASPEDLDVTLVSPSGSEHHDARDLTSRALGPLGSSALVQVPMPEAGTWTVEVNGFMAAISEFAATATEYRVAPGEGNWPAG